MMKTRTAALILAALCALVAAPALAANTPAVTLNNGLGEEVAADIEEYVIEQMKDQHSPGMAVGVVKGTTLVFEGYYGYADLIGREPVDESTMFRIASISKTMTAVGLMQEREKGKFQLDDDINNYLSAPGAISPSPDKPITFRSLLTHSSGGGELVRVRGTLLFYDGLIIRLVDDPANYPPLSKIVANHRMRNQLPPGTTWAYCNYGYAWLGNALENLSGEPFAGRQKKNIFDPLGMGRTSYEPSREMAQDHAKGYLALGGFYIQSAPFVWYNTPAAGVMTNVRDMAEYIEALANGGANGDTRLLKKATLDEMMDFHYTLDDRLGGYGLGFKVYGKNIRGRHIIGHGGNYLVQTSQFLVSPKDRVGVYVFSNSSSYSPTGIAWGVLWRALEARPEPLPRAEPDRSVRPKIAGRYKARYASDINTAFRLFQGALSYRVETRDGGLFIKGGSWKEPRRLLQADASDPLFFRVEDEEASYERHVSFKIGEDGEVSMTPNGLVEYVRADAALGAGE